MSVIKILVVDDEQSVRKLLKNQIGEMGYDCFLSEGVPQAIAVLETMPIDIVITDMHMPDRDGIELIKIVNEKYDADIIAMTGYVGDYAYEDLITLGATDFIQKPCSKGELRTRIKRAIKERTLMVDLKNSEVLYRALVEDMPALICRFDQAGTLTFVNNAYCQYFEKDAHELIGFNFFNLIPEKERERVRSHYQSLTPDKPTIMYEHQTVSPNGEIKWQQWIDHALFDRMSNNPEYQSIGIDITARKFKELEKRRLFEMHLKTQKLEALGTLSGGIAHEFNNILGSIIGYAQMIKMFDISDDHPINPSLDEILNAGSRAKELVEQILVFSQQDTLNKQRLDLKVCVAETIHFLRATIPASIVINEKYATDVIRINAIASQIKLVLTNIISNSRDVLCDLDGQIWVTVDLDTSQIESEAFHENESGYFACIEIYDSGPGISPDVQTKMFDPFFSTQKDKGSGMGLAVVHGVVEKHGGFIQFQNKPGFGACFQIFLPIANETSSEEAALKDTPLTGDATIMIIDDEPALVKWGQRVLSELGYNVIGLTDSVQAFEMLKKDTGTIDLVIADILMPYMTGIDLVRKIKILKKNIPFILCSGNSDNISKQELRQLGIDGIMMKPINIEDLAKKIRQILG